MSSSHDKPATEAPDAGQAMHAFARELWPINRSLTGDGVRETLARIKERVPELVVHEGPDRHARLRLDGPRRVERP